MDSLFATFPPTAVATWKEKLKQDLKGRSFEDLITDDNNGIPIFPFYTADTLLKNYPPVFQQANWDLCVSVPIDRENANAAALTALNGGASGLLFPIHQKKFTDWEALLQSISIPHIFTGFDFIEYISDNVASCKEYLERTLPDLTGKRCYIGYDPIAAYFTGNAPAADAATYRLFHEAAAPFSHLTVDTGIYQNGGGNAVTQLAFGLAHLNEYLYWLAEHNQLTAVKKIFVKTAAGTTFFEEIAKLRALRLTLPTLFDTYQMQPEICIMSETSDLYRSPKDIYNNILRDSLAGMASVLGGCDTLVIHNFDGLSPSKDQRFSDRIARNQQLIFREESYFNKVADVASGSFYLEQLSREMAEKAWELFQKVMYKGGIISHFEKGALTAEINAQASAMIDKYREGKKILVGVNKFLNPDEKTDHAEEPISAPAKEESKYIQPLNIAVELLKATPTGQKAS